MKRSFTLFILTVFLFIPIGCHQNGAGSADAVVHCRVFEIPVKSLHELVPQEERASIANSEYSVSTVSLFVIDALLEEFATDTGMLVDHSREISWWPRVADSWAYSRADGQLQGGGGGSGFIGVRYGNSRREIRIEYTVSHSINLDDSVQSDIQYEGLAPESGGLLFLTPIEREDGTALFHAILFETSNWQP